LVQSQKERLLYLPTITTFATTFIVDVLAIVGSLVINLPFIESTMGEVELLVCSYGII
jgi:hypothetical protein